MAKSIVLQVGHQNTQFNQDPQLRVSTGAPQEMGKNYKVVCRTAELLRARGFAVKQTDANADSDPSVTSVNWDMFLAVHCDADRPNDNGGGFTDFQDPAVDGNTKESQRIANAIADKFFSESGIERHDERRGNINVRDYYMWSHLTDSTPCVLIEMGESVDPHDSVILNDTERCAIALARGICNAFGVNYDLPISQPTSQPTAQPQVDNSQLIAQLRQTIVDKNNTISSLNLQIGQRDGKITKYETLLDGIAKEIDQARV